MFINPKYKNLEDFKSSFFSSEPFPHLILDDFIDYNYFENLTKVLKNSNITLGKNFNSAAESNKAISLNSELPVKLKEIIDYLNSEEWVKNLSKLTEIDDIFLLHQPMNTWQIITK